MQAHGHEYIEKRLAQFMAEVIPVLAKETPYRGCRNILQHYYKNTHSDEIGKAMYMGNWLTDHSQFFAPDFFFDFQYHLPKKLEDAEIVLSDLQHQISDLSKQPQLIGRVFNAFPALLQLLDTTATHLKDIRRYTATKKPSPSNFSYATKDAWWELAQSVIKVMGYKKFCMTKEQPLDDDTYMAILSSFIDQDTTPNENYQFKLNQYYPNDHLDRAFDTKYLKLERQKQRIANEWLQRQPKPRTKKEKKDNETEYNNRGSLRRNCFDDRYTSGEVYDYLQEYIDVQGQKLNYLSRELILPYFVAGNKQPVGTDFLVQCARLGHSLHGVEDFFAHSNYIELLVQNLDTLRSQMAEPDKYFTKGEFVELMNINTYQRDRLFNATKKAIRDITGSVQPTIDEVKLTTGIFAETDTYTSLYHLSFGMIEEEIENLKGESPTDDAATEVLQYLIAGISDYIQLLEQWPATLDKRYKIVAGQQKKFNAEILLFILNRNDEFRKSKTPRDARFEQYLTYIADMLNALYVAVAPLLTAKDSVVIVLKFVQVLLMLFFIPVMVLYFFKEILRSGVSRFILSEFVQYGFEKLANYVEAQGLRLNEKKMYGTHSIIAKDESYRNEVMHRQAQRMALFIDQFIVLSMLVGIDTEKQEQINMEALLHKYLKHPCPDINRSKEQMEQELAMYGTNSFVYVIDTITNKRIGVSLKAVFEFGHKNKIKSVSSMLYKQKFLEYNGEFIKDAYMEKEVQLTIDKIPIAESKNILFDTIILPYQNKERHINFANNSQIITKEIREVVIKSGGAINPNKMWKMQFFDKDDYDRLESNWKEVLLKVLMNKEPEQRVDEVSLEKDRLLFGSDKTAVSLIENTTKIKFEDVVTVFDKEVNIKKNYETFVEDFIKIHYE